MVERSIDDVQHEIDDLYSQFSSNLPDKMDDLIKFTIKFGVLHIELANMRHQVLLTRIEQLEDRLAQLELKISGSA